MLIKAGAKLRDFGLAKANMPVVAGAGPSMLPTIPPNLNALGTILGDLREPRWRERTRLGWPAYGRQSDATDAGTAASSARD